MKRQFVLILLLTQFMIFPAISVPKTDQSSMNIVVTTTIVEDIVTSIGGEQISVYTMISKGVDPHDYQPTTSDTTELENAEYTFYLGGGVEEGLESTLHNLKENNQAMALFDAIPKNQRLEISNGEEDNHDDQSHTVDPHFWHNPLRVKTVVKNITAQFIQLDKQNQDIYEENRDNYLTALSQLHNKITTKVNTLNESQKYLVTQHSAYNYWAEQYGFETRSLEGVSTSDEASLQEIDNLAQYIKKNKIRVIFTETTVSQDDVESLMDATRAIGWNIAIGGTLYSGSLGDGNQSTYIGMIQSNTDTIVDGIANPPDDTGEVDQGFLNTNPLYLMYGLIATFILGSRLQERRTNRS